MLLVLGSGVLTASAQTTAVCSNTPTSTQRIECTQASDSTTAIDIDALGVDIDTSADNEPAVKAQHAGDADIEINVAPKLTPLTLTDIDTTGAGSHGIQARHTGDGRVRVNAQSGNITTTGAGSHGIDVRHTGSIDRSVAVWINANAVDIRTEGQGSHGVHARAGADVVGQMLVDVDKTVTTTGADSHGVFLRHDGTGLIDLDVLSSTRIATTGRGVSAEHSGTGDIVLEFDRDVRIGTTADRSPAIYGSHTGTGNVLIRFMGTPELPNTITTTGAGSHGIVAYQHSTTADPRIIEINAAGEIDVRGTDSQGIRVGTVSAGVPSRIATLDEDGYRRQTVTVNGPITSAGEGVFMANGGRVIIGPRGSITSSKRIAILATGTVPAPDPNPDNVAAIPPKLRVDLNLRGRRVAQAIGDGWIINDGGETTIAVNGTVLHDGATGNTGRTAPNGAWNVTMRAQGVTVTDRTDPDPANWTISEPAANVVADRDFSAADFNERRRPAPPEPEPESGFEEVYAPRAAVYEGLVGALLRLGRLAGSDRRAAAFAELTPLNSLGVGQEHGPIAGRLRLPGSPLWFRLTGGTDSQKPESATVGAAYNIRRVVLETGLDVALGKHTTGSLAWYNVQGSVGVAAPIGDGLIAARGSGVSVGLAWEGADGFYSNGRLSATWFDVDAASRSRGTLEQGVDALVRSFDLEAGRRVDVGEQTRLTARSWLSRTEASLESFTDAVGAHVSLAGADALTIGAGGSVETNLAWNGGRDSLSLQGSLGVERLVGGGETVVLVSGEALRSTSPNGGVVLDVGATHRWGSRFTLDAQLRARGGVAGANDTDYSASLNFLMTF